MLPFIIIISVVVLLGAATLFVTFKRSRTKLSRLVKSQHQDEFGYAKRIYLRRPELRAKVWFEKSKSSPTAFEVHHTGDEGGFTVTTLTNEPLHLIEAREALHELGMDIDTTSWMQLHNAAE